MRLIVARCEVRYSGRLEALLPEALRLVMVKSDGSVMVHADTGGFKPQNWMTPPTVIELERGGDPVVDDVADPGTLDPTAAPDAGTPPRPPGGPHERDLTRMVVRKRAGSTEDRLDIRIAEIVSDVTHDMGPAAQAAGLEKTGVERELQELLAEAPHRCGDGFRLVRREWPTDIGPVDLMCRDGADGWVAVEIKRTATIDAVEQLTRYLERLGGEPGMGEIRGVLAAQQVRPQARVLAESRGIAWVEVDPAVLRGERTPALTLFDA